MVTIHLFTPHICTAYMQYHTVDVVYRIRYTPVLHTTRRSYRKTRWSSEPDDGRVQPLVLLVCPAPRVDPLKKERPSLETTGSAPTSEFHNLKMKRTKTFENVLILVHWPVGGLVAKEVEWVRKVAGSNPLAPKVPQRCTEHDTVPSHTAPWAPPAD